MIERFSKDRLEGDRRPTHVYSYYVSGNGAFPYDMLRYDACWPASGEDAVKMALTARDGSDAYRRVRSVRMCSYREPTLGRWASFMWSVGREKL